MKTPLEAIYRLTMSKSSEVYQRNITYHLHSTKKVMLKKIKMTNLVWVRNLLLKELKKVMFSILKFFFLWIFFFYSFSIKSNDYIFIESESFFDFKVKLATNPEDKKKGLMHIEKLKNYEGMLFIYNIPQKVNIWMHNTFIPLDVIFIDQNREVHLIEKGIPLSKRLISSNIEVKAVLEIPEDCANKIGIYKGDKLNWYKVKKNKNKEYYHCIDS